MSNPGTTEAMRSNPNGVASASYDRSHNPVGVAAHPTMFYQGSSCLATLGFGPESLWDSRWIPSKMWVILSLGREGGRVRASVDFSLNRYGLDSPFLAGKIFRHVSGLYVG